MTKATKRTGIILIALPFLLAFAAYHYHENNLDVLTRSRHTRIEVNGMAVKGEVLKGRWKDIITIRDKGREHSYFLYWHMTDTNEPMPVMDCGGWVAPNLPIYIAIRGYSNRCEKLPDTEWQRSALWFNVIERQFLTANGDVIELKSE